MIAFGLVKRCVPPFAFVVVHSCVARGEKGAPVVAVVGSDGYAQASITHRVKR
jgi:hypothetical protein